jgi:hypothetical protein
MRIDICNRFNLNFEKSIWGLHYENAIDKGVRRFITFTRLHKPTDKSVDETLMVVVLDGNDSAADWCLYNAFEKRKNLRRDYLYVTRRRNFKPETPCPCMRILSFCAVIIKEDQRVDHFITKKSPLVIMFIRRRISALVLSDALTWFQVFWVMKPQHKTDSFQGLFIVGTHIQDPADYKGWKVPEVLTSGNF